MTRDPVADVLARAVREQFPMVALEFAARALLAAGLEVGDIMEAFERARTQVPAESQDPLLDTMDRLVGWCSPGREIT